ncbi:MAG: DUF3108 domain-containing protein [Deltaproteobacteria bacterium]|nr:MAG: DUF3108 domain-containing protein [Deltaproteobacteria bacterium]
MIIRIIGILILVAILGWGQAGASPAAARDQANLENLQYRLSLGFFEDVARVRLSLSRVGPDRYRARFSGAAQGAWQLLKKFLPESYESEMALEDGRLKPLLYREKFYKKGQAVSKEYRFDYNRKVLEVWRGVDGRELEKDSEVPLQEPVYDPLTLFYNLRLGAVAAAPGQTLKVTLVPTPEPREMVLRVGPQTGEGCKTMIFVRSGQGSEDGPYFVFSGPQKVPLHAWVRVLAFGKLAGELLNPGEIMTEGLAASSQLSSSGGETRQIP